MVIYNIDFTNLSGFQIVSNTNIEWDSESLEISFRVVLKPLDDYDVIQAPSIDIEYNGYSGVIQQTITSTIVNDEYIIAFTSGIEPNEPTFTMAECFGTARNDIEIIDRYGVIRLYKTNRNIMADVKNARFELENNQYVDLGQFILSLTRYPFEIVNTTPANIQLGYKATTINAPMILYSRYEFDFGEIELKGLNGDTSDIDNCTINLLLPFLSKQTIDSKYINHILKVKYIVDIVTNSAICELYIDNVLINTIDCKIGVEIPYIIKPTNETFFYTKQIENSLNNCVANVVIEQNLNADEYFDTLETHTIKNCDGFIKVEEFNESPLPTTDENNLLKQLLEIQGVIYKKETN